MRYRYPDPQLCLFRIGSLSRTQILIPNRDPEGHLIGTVGTGTKQWTTVQTTKLKNKGSDEITRVFGNIDSLQITIVFKA